jgi:hypothetical protein
MRELGLIEKCKAKFILGVSDTETVKLDFDNTPFRLVKYWTSKAMQKFRLEGFVILKSSKNSYHAIFNRPVSWSENMRVVAWVSLLSQNKTLTKFLLMQCIKESSTLRVSEKQEKTSPRVVFRYGQQDKQITSFLDFRGFIKGIERKLNKKPSYSSFN